MAENIKKSKSGEFYKVGNDVFRASDDAHVTLDNPDPSLNFYKLGLNFALLPEGKSYKVGNDVYKPDGTKWTEADFVASGLNFALLPEGKAPTAQITPQTTAAEVNALREATFTKTANIGTQIMAGSSGYYVANAQGQSLTQQFPNYVDAQNALNIMSGQPATAPPPTTDSPTGDPVYDEALNWLKATMKEMKRRGEAINPYVEITPEKAAEFLAQAQREIGPYYASQLKAARDELFRAMGYAKDEIIAKERELERRYGGALRQVGATAAEQGFALSGIRQGQERELALGTQDQIDAARRQLQFQTTNLASQFARQYGYGDVPTGTIGEAPRVLTGEQYFQTQGREIPYYTLSPSVYEGLVGTQQEAQTVAERTRTAELEEAFRQQEMINKQRQLTI